MPKRKQITESDLEKFLEENPKLNGPIIMGTSEFLEELDNALKLNVKNLNKKHGKETKPKKV